MNKNPLTIGLIGAVAGTLLTVAGVGVGFYIGSRSAPVEEPAAVAPPPMATVHTPPAAAAPGQATAVPGQAAPDVHVGIPMPAMVEVEKFQVGEGNIKTMVADGPLTWVGSSYGVIRYNARTDQHDILNNKNSPIVSNGIFFLTRFDNKLWVGTYGGGLHSYDGQNWRSYNIPHGLGDAFVYGLTKTPAGDIWIATWSGANRIRGGNMDDPAAWDLFTVENTAGGLPNDWVYAIDYDSKGNIWMGTEGGVARFDGSSWQTWRHGDGLGAPYEVVKDDLIRITDAAGGQSQHHARQKVEMGLSNISEPFNPNYIVSMLVDDKDRVWLGTWGGGLSILKDGQFRTYTTNDGLLGNYVSMLKRGPDSTIWVGSNQGLSKVIENDGRLRFANYTVNDGLYSRMVFSMAFSEDHSVWVGTYGGVSHYPKGLPQKNAADSVKRLVPAPTTRTSPSP